MWYVINKITKYNKYEMNNNYLMVKESYFYFERKYKKLIILKLLFSDTPIHH